MSAAELLEKGSEFPPDAIRDAWVPHYHEGTYLFAHKYSEETFEVHAHTLQIAWKLFYTQYKQRRGFTLLVGGL